MIAQAHYRVRNAAVLRAALRALEHNPTETRSYAWASDNELLGFFALDDDVLVAQTDSRERLAQMRAWLEGQAGDAVAHELDAFFTPDGPPLDDH